jgi:hypothetical protein
LPRYLETASSEQEGEAGLVDALEQAWPDLAVERDRSV